MQTTHDFNQFCEKYNYDFQDEIEDFQENHSAKLDTSEMEVRVYDSGNDVTVSLHYFAGYNSGFRYTAPDGYVEIYGVTMPDAQNEQHVRGIVQALTA